MQAKVAGKCACRAYGVRYLRYLPNVTEMGLDLEPSTPGIQYLLYYIGTVLISNPRLDLHRYSITGRFTRALIRIIIAHLLLTARRLPDSPTGGLLLGRASSQPHLQGGMNDLYFWPA